MNHLEGVKSRYFTFIIVSVIAAATILIFGNSQIPIQYTQILMTTDTSFNRGLHENIIDLEEKIQKGVYPLVDNVQFLIKTQSYRATVTKMAESTKGVPSTKYRIEMHFHFPYTDISRHTKLDAILVDVNPEQNHEFADLFWNLE